jgi:hypothetical protein
MADEFKVLGYDLRPLVDEFDLKYSVYAYVVLILFTVVSLPVGYAKGYYETPDPGLARTFSFIIVGITFLAIPLTALAVLGFIDLGVRWGNRFLVHSTMLFFLVGLLFTVVPLVSEIMFITTLKTSMMLELAAFVAGAVLNGLAGLVFGIALLRANKGGLVQAAGFSNILLGLANMTIIGALVAVLLNIPLMCLEAYILYDECRRRRSA